MDNIKRGEMFYISRGGASYSGSEQHSDRPAVVVSNNKNNENSNVVEIVYMTTQPKTDLPTHVTVRSTGRPSTVLCDWEQRLNPFNLIPLNHKTHNTITALYKQSKASMRATQKQLRSLIEYHFREAGGYKKVLCDSFLVAPPLLFGENSPREFQ